MSSNDNSGAAYSHLYTDIQKTSTEDTKQNILAILTSKGTATAEQVEEYESKLKGKHVLLDNPESRRLLKKKAKKNSPKKSNVMRSVARRSIETLGDGDDGNSNLQYGQLLALNRLWEGYIRDLISRTQKSNIDNALVRADYHGAHLKVTQSKCFSFIGQCGIVIQETLHTFTMMKNDSMPICIPKRGSVFTCNIKRMESSNDGIVEWQLFGDQLCQHSGLRSSKKFKAKPSISL